MTAEMGSNSSDRVVHLERWVRWLTVGLVVSTLAWCGTVAWVVARGNPTKSLDVLSVERLEIVEPDGRLAFVLANSARPVPATIDGRVILEGQEEERRNPTFIFFDGKGDEVGGMTFANEENEDGFHAVRHFAMDGYEQDETVAIRHHQDSDGSSTGLYVTDRPQDRSILDVTKGLGLGTGPTREELESAIDVLREEDREAELQEIFGVNRLFLGSDRNDLASLVLKDGQGRPRIVLGVPEAGDPFLRILDEDGEIISELPE